MFRILIRFLGVLEQERPASIADQKLVRLHMLESAFRPDIPVKVELPISDSEITVASEVNQSANPTGSGRLAPLKSLLAALWNWGDWEEE